MRLTDLDFTLPPELIAQAPVPRRDQSRLLVVNRQSRSLKHRQFSDLPELLGTPCPILRNNASVLPARLTGHRTTGGKIECLLLHPGAAPDEWWCLLNPARKVPPGVTWSVDGGATAEVKEIKPSGERLVRFHLPENNSVVSFARAHGRIPLPPYIKRGPADPLDALDRERYETVYADKQKPVAAAAPTAGLHFTPELLQFMNAEGFIFTDVTLHVGLGTFQPIQAEQIEDHAIHRELYEIPPSTMNILNNPAAAANHLVVGTTTFRSVEDYFRKRNAQVTAPVSGPFIAEADLFVRPPFSFGFTKRLLTNFHLPRSSLLCLVAAFLSPDKEDGLDWLHEIYAEAIRERYRFFSYGDAMLIE